MATAPIEKAKRIRDFLTEAAVADASHDFQGGRAGESLFSKIYRKFKPIGTPYTPTFDKPENEWNIINKMFKFLDGTEKTETDETRKFKEVFLKVDPASPNMPQTIGTFQRFAEDPKPYKIQALKIANKSEKEGGKKSDYLWTYSSQELFDILSDDKLNLYFTVDACNIPFYDLLQNDSGSGTKKATCVYTRESVNDAAGKKEFTDIPGKLVSFDSINDSASFNILYPGIQSGTTEEELNKLTEIECFLSIYNLTLSSIDPKNNSVTLSITNKDMSKQVQITKHDKEDAHPNSVPALSEKIKKIIEKLTKPLEQMNYYSYLQQKRSGDWLQCLACTNPVRFGLPENTRIKLVTLDKICMAYALFCGIDVIFTYYNQEDRTCWLITFFKEREAPKPEQVLQTQLNTLPNPTTITNYINNPLDVTYDTCYDLYSKYYNDYEAVLKKNVKDSSTFPETKQRNVFTNEIRKYLRAILSLGVFRAMATKLDGTKPQSIYAGGIPTVTKENYTAYKKKFDTFQTDYHTIKKALLSRKNKPNMLNAELQIRDYFETIVKMNYEGSATDKKRAQLVDNLSIFSGLFSPANAVLNGVGIFEFINNTCNNAEKEEIKAQLESFATKLGRITPNELNAYNKFLKIINFTMNEEEEVPDNSIAENDALTVIIDTLDTQPVEIDDDLALEKMEEKVEDKSAIDEVVESAPATVSVNTTTDIKKLQDKIMKQVSKVEQPARAFEVTDFGPALKILKGRVKEFTNVWANRLRARITATRKIQEGGARGLPSVFHNPLITIYFLLRELSFRLSYEEVQDDLLNYRHYIQIIESLLIKADAYAKTMSEKLGEPLFESVFKYYYYKSFEIYFLEYAEYDDEFPVSTHMTKDIALTIKKGYYGIETLPNIKENYIYDKEIAQLIFREPFHDMDTQTYIQKASSMRVAITKHIGEFERSLDHSIQNISDEFIDRISTMLQATSVPIITQGPATLKLAPAVTVYGGKRGPKKSRKNTIKKILKRPFRKTRQAKQGKQNKQSRKRFNID
jgi:hypothetical protein